MWREETNLKFYRNYYFFNLILTFVGYILIKVIQAAELISPAEYTLGFSTFLPFHLTQSVSDSVFFKRISIFP